MSNTIGSRLAGLIIAVVAALLVIATLAPTVDAATDGFEIVIPVNTVERGGTPGEIRPLKTVDVPGEFVGALCEVTAVSQNQGSVHPGNNLIVESGGSTVVLEDVESGKFVTVVGSGQLVLGPTVVVSLEFGGSTFSAGIDVVIDCTQPPPEPQPVTVTVTDVCNFVEGQPVGTATVTIDPDTKATVSIYSDAGKTILVETLTASGDTGDLVPGTYYWTAVADEGYLFGDETDTATGQFTIEDCTPTTTPPTTPPPTTPPPTTPPAPLIETTVGCELDTSKFVVAASNVGTVDVLVGIVWDSGSDSANLKPGEVLRAVVPAGENWTIFEAGVPVEQGKAVSCDQVSPTSIVNTTAPEVSPETLPFTGADSGPHAALALLLVAAGALALVGARVFRADTEE